MDGRTCLLMGAGSTVLPNIYRFFEETEHLPITGYHVMPIDRKLNTAAIVQYYSDLAERSPLPLWLYSNPARMLQFPVEAVQELAQHPNIVGMKVGGYDMALASKLATLSSEEFQVVGAGGSNLLGYLAYGIECVTMSTASCFPEEYTQVFELWQQGEIDQAREKAFWINQVIGAIAPWKNSEDSAELKAVLEIFGICKRWTYPPFQPCTDGEVESIRKALLENNLL
jgi:dihydrodipicolinate synthase/N-acetylneuraminate lyase